MNEELVITEKDNIDNIADAVREQTGETELMSIKDIPSKIRTLSSGGHAVQSDLGQNDETAPDYVKNRTHYIDKSAVVALPQTTVEVRSGNVDLYEVPVVGLTDKAECVITIDGVSYEAVATKGTFNAYEWYVIGNGELIGEGDNGSDLPFGIFIDKYNENYMTLEEKKTGTIQLTIEVVSEVVHKIPEIYLPAKIGIEGSGTYSEIFNDLSSNTASGDYSHAENFKTTARGYSSHAEGLSSIASGYGAHSEGANTIASGPYAHSEGYYTEANGNNSHAEGEATIANGKNQHVSGTYNIADTTSLVIVGNGSGSSRSNAYKLDTYGNGYYTGNIYANKSDKVATEEYVNIRVPAWSDTDEGKVLKIINGTPTWSK